MRDLGVIRRFYEAALAPLGFDLLHSNEGQAGFGLRGRDRSADDVWILAGDTPHTGMHVAFATPIGR